MFRVESTALSDLSRFVRSTAARGILVVQPRMGWGTAAAMRRGLESVRINCAHAVGTITLDSYTRVGDYRTPLECLCHGDALNGYPIVSHPVSTTQAIIAGICDDGFPVQVRHGTSQPQDIFKRMVAIGLDATEGGPISYCLPYGRTPLATAIRAWQESCRILASETRHCHIESFGGCLMGQLCPPSLLIAVSLLECLFFIEQGVTSVSLSYAQGTSYLQDRAALRVMRELASRLLEQVDWHVVVYTYMGCFPETDRGAYMLIADSARLARESACERLIVKTRAESRQIPTLEDNLIGLHTAELAARNAPTVHRPSPEEIGYYEEIRSEAELLLETVLNLRKDVSTALLVAFRHGILDVPYCLHPDNRGNTRSRIDERGLLQWTATGNLPFRCSKRDHTRHTSSVEFLRQLSYVASRYDTGGDLGGPGPQCGADLGES